MEEPDLYTLRSAVAGTLDREVTAVERMGGGRNSRVYRLICDGSGSCVAKFYHRHHADPRDRLEAEFSALRFLWGNGVRCIPRPLAAERDSGYALYSYVEGRKISPQEVTPVDVRYAVRFLAMLEGLKASPDSHELLPASEACFSLQDIVGTIEGRWEKLSALDRDGGSYDALRSFLEHKFAPAFAEIIDRCGSQLGRWGLSFDSEVPYPERTLSPSDFGFHNALRTDGGQIVFLDFEYFGWDDPAKMIADFLLHPAMELREGLKRQFMTYILHFLPEREQLSRRVKIVYPLFGLKWCLILLNEFRPEHLDRRGFASPQEFDVARLQMEQLRKSRRMLHTLMREHHDFPYYA